MGNDAGRQNMGPVKPFNKIYWVPPWFHTERWCVPMSQFSRTFPSALCLFNKKKPSRHFPESFLTIQREHTQSCCFYSKVSIHPRESVHNTVMHMMVMKWCPFSRNNNEKLNIYFGSRLRNIVTFFSWISPWQLNVSEKKDLALSFWDSNHKMTFTDDLHKCNYILAAGNLHYHKKYMKNVTIKCIKHGNNPSKWCNSECL